MNDLKILNDLINSANYAKMHFEVFWALVSDLARPKYRNAMNAHKVFFRASINAHYTAFFVYLAHLYDSREDSSSISTYLKCVASKVDPLVFSEHQRDFELLLVRAKPILKGRHKSVAHIDAKLTEKEIFKVFSITWNETRDVIYDSAKLVAKLSGVQELGAIGICRDNRLINSTLSLLEALEPSSSPPSSRSL